MTPLNRRTFVKLAASTAAVSTVPLLAQGQQPIRFAAVGLGTISDIFIKACSTSTKCKITALVSGHAQDKAPRYTSTYNIPQSSVYTYERFDEIAHNPNIDAVYIGLPNSMHAEYTIRAAKAGKHVLCEKPMAISSAESQAMIDACKKANVKLMIAYRVHYDPTWIKIRDLAHSGVIGDIQGLQGGFYGQQKTGAWRLDRALAGGGSLMDLGIYPLNAVRWITGEEPVSYTAQISTKIPGPRFASVEENIEFTYKMPSGILVSSGSSYGENGGNYLNINGSSGSIQVTSAYSYQGVKYTGRNEAGPIQGASDGVAPYQFTLEADHLADCIHNNTQPLTPGEEGHKDMLAMEAIYKAAGAPIA